MEPLWKSNGVIAGAVILGLAVIGVALWYTGAIQIGEPRAPSLDEELSISADLPEDVRGEFPGCVIAVAGQFIARSSC